MKNAEIRALCNALMSLKIFRKIIRVYNGPRLIARVTSLCVSDICIIYMSHRENVKRWINIWRWRRCYSSKLSVHPPVLRIQSSSICLRVSPWTLPYYPYPFIDCWVTVPCENQINRYQKATIFFIIYICESAVGDDFNRVRRFFKCRLLSKRSIGYLFSRLN